MWLWRLHLFFHNKVFNIHVFTLTIFAQVDEQLNIPVPPVIHMKSAKTLFSQNNSSQTNANGQSSSNTQESQDNTMALVYPDGRVTNIKVGEKKS